MSTVDMESLKPNSNKYKLEQSAEGSQRKKLDSVVKIGAVSTKKPLSKRIVENFIGGDPEEVACSIWRDTIVPGAQNLLLDILSMAFFGERNDQRRGSGKYSYRGRDYEDYSRYYKGRTEQSRERSRRRDQNRRDGYHSITLTNRADAEAVIDNMRGRIREYGSVSLAELYDLIGMDSMDYTDNNWGWDDERDLGIRVVSNGFHLDLADVKYLS